MKQNAEPCISTEGVDFTTLSVLLLLLAVASLIEILVPSHVVVLWIVSFARGLFLTVTVIGVVSLPLVLNVLCILVRLVDLTEGTE